MNKLEINNLWTMIPLSEVDNFINFIKSNLSKSEELICCDFFPEVKVSGKDIYIVQDEAMREYYYIDFHKKSADQYVTPIGGFEGFIKKMEDN